MSPPDLTRDALASWLNGEADHQERIAARYKAASTFRATYSRRAEILRGCARALSEPAAPAGAEVKPNLFWDDENPEESFTCIEDLADYIGERAISLKIRTARSLPDAWVSAIVADDDSNWIVKYHATKDEANAEVTRALATPQPVEPPDDSLNDIAAGNEAARDDEWGEAGGEEDGS